MTVDTVRITGARSVKPVRRILHNRLLVNGSTIAFAVLVLLAIFAPLITRYNPTLADLSVTSQPPSAAHWFGTDVQGMDVFTRVLYGARTDLLLSVLGILAAMVIGLVLGSLAAAGGRIVDEVLSRIMEMIQAIPLFLFALIVVAALGSSSFVIGAVIAVYYAPAFFKISRSIAAPVLRSDFVAVSKTAGRTTIGVVLHHIVPNTMVPVMSQVSVNIGFAIQMIAGLSFLGLGIPVPKPEWGAMISVGAPRLAYGEWWSAVFPGVAVFITVIALDGIGRRLSAERTVSR